MNLIGYIRFYVFVGIRGEGLPDTYPAHQETDPEIVDVNPMSNWKPPKAQRKEKDVKAKPQGRKVKSYSIAGNEITLNPVTQDTSEEEHKRVKRDHVSVGIRYEDCCIHFSYDFEFDWIWRRKCMGFQSSALNIL